MKKGSKKIFTLLLSAIMLVTSIPLGTFIATAADSTYSLKDLETLMTKFEKIISDGTVYTNAGNAYEAYVQCQKAYDAYEYGANKDVDISGAAAALDGAMLSMDKWEIPTPVANPIPSFDGGTVPESAYANILCSNRRNAFASADFTFITNQWKTWGVTYTCRTNVQIGYNETVMFYDGITQPKMPVMAFTDYQNAVGGKRDHYLYSCYPDTTDLYLADQWHSDGGAAWNFSDRYNGTSRVGHDANTFVSGPNLRDENWHGYSNILLFNTNISWENTYYKTYKNLSWTAYAGESSTPNKDHVGSDAVNDNSTIYVINYSPLREKIVNYPKSVPNVSNYREGGLADLFEAYNIATAVNPNDYDYSSDTAQAVEACADSIEKAVEAADKATAGNTDSEAYKNLRQAITDNAAVDKADGCPGAKSEYESALAAARSAMSAVYTDEKGYRANDDNTIQALADELDKKAEAYMASSCDYKWDKDAADKAEFVCANGREVYTVEIQNYNTAAMIYSTLDSSKYTTEAWNVIVEKKAEFDLIKTSNHKAPYTQTDVDGVTTNLLNAINAYTAEDDQNLSYNVTFKVVVDGTEYVIFSDESVAYGKIKDITIPSEYQTENTVSKSWVVTFDDDNTKKAMAVDAYSYPLLVQQNTTITAYLSTDANVITILNQYGNVMYQFPSTGQKITFEGNDVIIDDVHYNVPNMPYMAVTGFTVNGSPAEEAITADSPIVIRPVFEKTANAAYTVTIDGETVSDHVKYDQRIKVTSKEADCKGIAIFEDGKYSIVSYSNEYNFYANRSMNFYTVTVEDGKYKVNNTEITDPLDIYSLDNSLPFVYSAGAITPDGKFTTFSAFTKEIPANVTVIEVGTIYSRENLNEADFKLNTDNTAVYQSVSKGQVDLSNQYSLTMSASTIEKGTVYTRAYVKYTYNYNDAEITAIAYGNICSSDITVA